MSSFFTVHQLIANLKPAIRNPNHSYFHVHSAASVCYFNFSAGGFQMSIKVRIPSTLRQYTEQKSEIDLEGKTVREVIENFRARFPDADARFFSTKTSRYMNLYLNDQNIRSLNDLDTAVSEKDVLSIVFAIAGG
jgi:molybdopterin synthase sulfur carrier subunit